MFAGVVMTLVLFLTLSYFYAVVCQSFAPASAWGDDGLGVDNATTPWGVLINLYVFGMLIIALWATLVLVHDRSLLGMFGPLGLAVRQFKRVGLWLVGLYLVLSILPQPEPIQASPNLPFGQWVGFLPLAFLGLLIQTTAEEIVFRGYLQSQLAARFSHPAVWIGVPSAMFAMLHYAPLSAGENAWVLVVWAGLFGVAAADLTARSGTLGPAIALHLVNNVSAILIAAPTGSFDGLALYTFPFSLDGDDTIWVWAPFDIMVLLCSWLTARLALRR